MIQYISQNGRVTYGLNHYVLDDQSDLTKLTTSCAMGSTATVIATGNVYMLNSKKKWILQPKTTSSGGGGGTGSTNSYSATIYGDGASTTFAVAHNLGTEAVVVSVYDVETKEECGFDVEITDMNTVTIKSDVVPTAAESFTVVVTG